MYTNRSEEQQKAEAIRRAYLPPEEDTLAQLKKLDAQVKTPGRVAALCLGVIGALVLGGGMSCVMVWDNLTAGLALGIPGLAAAALAFPLYRRITERRRKTYAPEILRLSDELLQ